MIRRISDIVLILLFVWASMILGLWIIDSLIVPLRLPIPGLIGDFATGVAKVVIGAVLALFWLWLWRTLVRWAFWRALRRYPQT